MFIDISSILGKKGEQKEFSFTENIANIKEFSPITAFEGPITVKGIITNSGASLDIEADGHANIVMPCDRCSKGVKIELDFSVEENFFASGTAQEDQESYSGNKIEADGVVRKSILSNLPMKVLCCEDCKGLCPQCGKDLNTGECGCKTDFIDPRFESLRSLFKVDEEV